MHIIQDKKYFYTQNCQTEANECRYYFHVIIQNITVFTFQVRLVSLSISENNFNKPKIISFDPKLNDSQYINII